eukprot:353163-Chlamydomonas_euryale.AAC.4
MACRAGKARHDARRQHWAKLLLVRLFVLQQPDHDADRHHGAVHARRVGGRRAARLRLGLVSVEDLGEG